VYVELVQKSISSWASPKTRRLHERVGKPCIKAHNERRGPAYRKVLADTIAEQRRRFPGPTKDQRQIRLALQQFDEAEHNKLVAWFEENYALFSDLGSARG
jgi:hypothetical protein